MFHQGKIEEDAQPPLSMIDWDLDVEDDNESRYRALVIQNDKKVPVTHHEMLESEPVMRSLVHNPSSDLERSTDWDISYVNKNDLGIGMVSLNQNKLSDLSIFEPEFGFKPSITNKEAGDMTKSTPLANAPFFLERYSSFYCRSKSDSVQVDPTLVLQTLATCLLKCDTDNRKINVDIMENSNQIRGTGLIHNSPVRFTIQLYKTSSKTGDILVECQRRSGDSFSFQELYRNALECLSDSDTAPFIVSELVPVQTLIEKKTLPDSLTTIKLDKLTLDPLVAMIQSTKSDVNEQALHALTDLCESGENIDFFVTNTSSESLFYDLLTRSTTNILLCIVRILQRIADRHPKKISKTFINQLRKTLDNHNDIALQNPNDGDKFAYTQLISQLSKIETILCR